MVKPFDLEKLFTGSLDKLRTEAKYLSQLTDHPGELGRINESHLVNFLRGYLPQKIGVSTGFIASGGGDGIQSPQCDIILYDAINNAPLYQSEAWSIFPIEMVYGVIEVKTTLGKTELADALKKCAKIRAMATGKNNAPNKKYLRLRPVEQRTTASFEVIESKLPPRFFIFAYKGFEDAQKLKSACIEKWENQKDSHLHGVCILNEQQSLYATQIAFSNGKFEAVGENGFREFLSNMPLQLNSMLRADRKGIGFDIVDLKHYQLASDKIQKIAKDEDADEYD